MAKDRVDDDAKQKILAIMSGNRKDLKCVVCRRCRRRRPSSVSIDSHVQYILFLFYLHYRKTYSVHYFTFFIQVIGKI